MAFSFFLKLISSLPCGCGILYEDGRRKWLAAQDGWDFGVAPDRFLHGSSWEE